MSSIPYNPENQNEILNSAIKFFKQFHIKKLLMLAFKEKEGYKEGTTWTNFTPYGSEGPWGG